MKHALESLPKRRAPPTIGASLPQVSFFKQVMAGDLKRDLPHGKKLLRPKEGTCRSPHVY